MSAIKTLVLNGSPRKNGATASILNMIVNKLRKSIEYEWFNASDLKIKPCQGCMACRPDKVCILPEDDGHLLGDKLNEADLLILGSPSYWGNLPSPLKVIFDRNVSVLEYCLDKPPIPNMTGKSAILVVTCASAEPRSEEDNQLPLLVKNLYKILAGSGYKILQIIKLASSWEIEFKQNEIKAYVESIDLGIDQLLTAKEK
jgi:multimeric flavodoxin WrbA